MGRSNRLVAWTGFCLGVLSGSLMGLWAFNGPLDPPIWIGDYEDTSRRLVRLGHISFFGIGILNLLLARELPGFDLEGRGKALAFRCMNAANILLPALLFAAAAYAPLKYLLPIPVDELESGLRWLFSEVYNEREFRRRKRHYMEIVKARPPRTAPGRRDEAGAGAAH